MCLKFQLTINLQWFVEASATCSASVAHFSDDSSFEVGQLEFEAFSGDGHQIREW